MLEEPLSSVPHRHEIAVDGRVWIDLERPTSGEIEILTRDYGLDRADLDAALSRGEASGLFTRGGYISIVFELPYLASGRPPGRVVPSPVALFAGRDFLVTIHTGEIRPLIRLFQQCENDPVARDAAFALGIPGLVYVVVQRLIDAAAASRARIDRALGAEDYAVRPSRTELAQARRLRADARAIWRLVTPLPELVRALARQFPIAPEREDAWGRVETRAERLVSAVEDDLAALDGVFLAATAGSGLETSRLLHALLVVAALTLPPIAVAIVLAMPLANPLAAVPGGYAIGLAIVGVAFLASLAILKRRHFL